LFETFRPTALKAPSTAAVGMVAYMQHVCSNDADL
jgi:hypothetical protein